MNASARTCRVQKDIGCVRTDASVLPASNFITDAIVCPSHGRPSGHRYTIRLSVCYRPRDNPGFRPENKEHTCRLGTDNIGNVGVDCSFLQNSETNQLPKKKILIKKFEGRKQFRLAVNQG
jgi:hypothetical protein